MVTTTGYGVYSRVFMEGVLYRAPLVVYAANSYTKIMCVVQSAKFNNVDVCYIHICMIAECTCCKCFYLT